MGGMGEMSTPGSAISELGEPLRVPEVGAPGVTWGGGGQSAQGIGSSDPSWHNPQHPQHAQQSMPGAMGVSATNHPNYSFSTSAAATTMATTTMSHHIEGGGGALTTTTIGIGSAGHVPQLSGPVESCINSISMLLGQATTADLAAASSARNTEHRGLLIKSGEVYKQAQNRHARAAHRAALATSHGGNGGNGGNGGSHDNDGNEVIRWEVRIERERERE